MSFLAMGAIAISASRDPRPYGWPFGAIRAALLLSLLLREALLRLLPIQLCHLLQGILRGLLRSGGNLKIDMVTWVTFEPMRRVGNEQAVVVDAYIGSPTFRIVLAQSFL
jgi:hypothetical protein